MPDLPYVHSEEYLQYKENEKKIEAISDKIISIFAEENFTVDDAETCVNFLERKIRAISRNCKITSNCEPAK